MNLKTPALWASNHHDAGPLDNLLAFHRSIRAALRLFDEAVARAANGLVDVNKTLALCDFFQGPMQWHDEDESLSLLPRLRHALQPATDDCDAEHRRMDAALRGVLGQLRDSRNVGPAPDVALLRSTAAELREVIEPHLQREETEIYPAARALFCAGDLAAMALEMQARRLRRWSKARPGTPASRPPGPRTADPDQATRRPLAVDEPRRRAPFSSTG